MIKLEKLSNSKFQDFKSNEIQKSFRIIGGEVKGTTYRGSDGRNGRDVLDEETNGGQSIDNGDSSVDYRRLNEEERLNSDWD